MVGLTAVVLAGRILLSALRPERILVDMYDEGLITGPDYHDRESIRIHGARAIIEPEWRM